MVFRIKDEKLYVKRHLKREEEDAFLKVQEQGQIEFVHMDIDELPVQDSIPFSHTFYKREENSIVVDTERSVASFMKGKEKEYKKYISKMLEEKAKDLGFENFYTASAYLTQGNNPLKPLAEKLGTWGGNVWGASMQIQKQVQSGEIDMPQTWEELKGMLPQWEE